MKMLKQHMMHPRQRQRGAVAILVGICIVVFVGFLALVFDLGRLFVAKTELQNAADACALAAAGGLPPVGTLTVAESRGILVGQKNKVEFQANNVVINVDSDVTFSTTLNGTYLPASSADPTSQFVKCTVEQGGIVPWFLHVFRQLRFEASTPDLSVGAFAVATLAPAQTSCAIPVGLCSKPGSIAPDFGFTVGKWESSKFPVGGSFTGSFNWIDFSPPSGGASELATLLTGVGQCALPDVGQCVGQSGDVQSLARAWNTRFGLYQGSYNAGNALMDKTGVAYKPTTSPDPATPLTWREFSDAPQNAYNGTPDPALASPPSNFFTEHNTTHTPYQTSTNPNAINPLNASTTAQHAAGGNRRVVVVPVVNCAAWASGDPGCGSQQARVLGFACVLMLHPFDSPDHEIFLEYLGHADDPNSPCHTSGLPGGSLGPLVPVLVQ